MIEIDFDAAQAKVWAAQACCIDRHGSRRGFAWGAYQLAHQLCLGELTPHPTNLPNRNQPLPRHAARELLSQPTAARPPSGTDLGGEPADFWGRKSRGGVVRDPCALRRHILPLARSAHGAVILQAPPTRFSKPKRRSSPITLG